MLRGYRSARARRGVSRGWAIGFGGIGSAVRGAHDEIQGDRGVAMRFGRGARGVDKGPDGVARCDGTDPRRSLGEDQGGRARARAGISATVWVAFRR
jgi:hypothetical protein